MARITTPAGTTSTVRDNIQWMLRKARTTGIKSIVLTHVEHSYVMETIFDDNYVFVMPFAGLDSFKSIVSRRHQLKGCKVALIDGSQMSEFTLKGKKR